MDVRGRCLDTKQVIHLYLIHESSRVNARSERMNEDLRPSMLLSRRDEAGERRRISEWLQWTWEMAIGRWDV